MPSSDATAVYVYLQRNAAVLTALEGCQTLLRKSTKEPTRCRELVSGWPDYIGIVDASGHGVGGVVLGELTQCTPIVFRWEWPADIKQNLISSANPTGGDHKLQPGDGGVTYAMVSP